MKASLILCLASLIVAGVLPQAYGRELSRDCDTFQCPSNSFIKDGVRCLDSFRDCKCDEGYKPKNQVCIPCPKKKICKQECRHERQRICKPVCEEICKFGEGDGHCRKVCRDECEHKTVRVCENVCKRKRVCECEFVCPANSDPRGLTQCLDTIGDCKCRRGYRMVRGECIPTCSFKCPKDSIFLGPKDECPRDSDDCKCRDGYRMVHGKCIRECFFKCPRNSIFIGQKDECPHDSDDCKCRAGYRMKHDRCVKCEGTRACAQ